LKNILLSKDQVQFIFNNTKKEIIEKNDNILYKMCQKCQNKKYETHGIISNKIKNPHNFLMEKIKTMLLDEHLYPRVKLKLPNHDDCINNIIKYQPLNMTDMIYTCEKCKKYWIIN